MMRWIRNRSDDELPDAVVRMYRESLDDDGLDFLRRGPRTAAERLAYAQRVHPDAYRTAPPAPASAQAAFARRGFLDGRRHFVGSDRNLYLRGETAAEPLHASIRRGFETAVPGFRSANLAQALAETEALTDGDGSAVLTGDASSDQLTGAGTMPAGWSPRYKAGPLRMKEIETWTRSATPAEARAVDPQTREDALRLLSSRVVYGRAPDKREEIGRTLVEGLQLDEGHLEHQREKDDAFIAWLQRDPAVAHHAKNWSTLSLADRELLLELMIRRMGAIYGFDMPEVRIEDLNPGANAYDNQGGGTYGLHHDRTNEVLVDPDLIAPDALGTAAHEALHEYQWRLVNDYFNGHLQPSDPRYKLAELMALNHQFRLPKMRSFGDFNPYRDQPYEDYAFRLGKRVVPLIKAMVGTETGTP